MPEENINIVIAHYTFLDRISGVNIVMADLAQGLCEIAGTKKARLRLVDEQNSSKMFRHPFTTPEKLYLKGFHHPPTSSASNNLKLTFN